jgi:hypothetical protein
MFYDSNESRHWPPVAREDDILATLSPFHEVGEQALSVAYGYVHLRHFGLDTGPKSKAGRECVHLTRDNQGL